jgi:Taurine catabolism dioxygenase TauD, TfdA family
MTPLPMENAMQTYEHESASFAWRAASFRNPSDYVLELGPADRAEIAAALGTLERSGRLAPAQALTKKDFPFAGLGAKLARGYEEVRSGRGFVVLRGLAVEGLALEQFTAAVWGIGTRFGRALSQNAQGESVTAVVDATAEDATPRMYRSNLELRPHSDITAMISLACWHKSQSGGASIIVSGVTVHDAIRARAPHLLEPLYRGYHYHRLGEQGPGEEPATPYRTPVFANRNGQLSCRYQRSGIAGGHRELGVPLDERDIEALNLFDEVAAAPENRLAFFLERGDMLVVNNYAVMHARTRFTNFPEPERRRHLVRLWLDNEGFRDVPKEFNLFKANGVPKQEGRRASFDFAKLYRDDPVATGGVPDLKVSDSEATEGR